ncbi:MAG: Mur ligase family protein [Patescibacteria group bacterium]|nr:Mur ligase family protein [Patescibacteria group bacterium]
MKKFVEKCLADRARALLRRTRPEIVAITGSVGKSSTKEAVAAVLSMKYRVGWSRKNYNTEYGLPLALLRLDSPGRSAFGWLMTLKRARWRSWFPSKDYPKTWVLEMGADKPGDIAYLCDIAAPDIAVVTAVGEAHVEKFGSVEAVAEEKGTLVERLPEIGVAVLNRDDERVWAMRTRTKAKIMTFGFDQYADVRAVEMAVHVSAENPSESGTRLKVSAGGATVPMFVPGMIGRPAAYAALAAAAVGLAKGMNLVEVGEGLQRFVGSPGRLRCLGGIKRTVLIDDSYNASPRSVIAALETLKEAAPENAKRFAVLGDMLELGPLAVSGHEEVGRKAVECADTLVFVGSAMADAEKAAVAAGASSDRVFHFGTPEEAGRFVQERMHQGDVVLIKGSRGMKMELVTKELMADPVHAFSLLPGSHPEWEQ